MAMNLAAMASIINPGYFKAQKKNPEKLSLDFDLYLTSFNDFLMVTGNEGADNGKNKALLRAVGGLDMVWLFDFVGKVSIVEFMSHFSVPLLV